MKIKTLGLVALLASTAAIGANSAPQPVPYDDPIPPAKDVAYPGTVKVAIDATDTTRGIFRIKETVPVADAGPLTLLYPKWLPGTHSPRGDIAGLAGLTITAGGKVLGWTRDPVDVYAFTVDVPKGVRSIEASFQYLSPTAAAQGRVVTTPDMLNLQWIANTLYPAGYFTRRIPVVASVTYPAGFKAATALEIASTAGDTVTYKPVSYEVLADSPVYAGRYFVREELCPTVFLNVVGDSPKQVEIKPETLEKHRHLCQQAVRLFGAQHYDHYDFLFSISDKMGGNGLEHHRSSEDGVGLGYFTEWDQHLRDHDLLPHEYTHSWDGKYRRGADLWTPDFRTPMRDSLLWVYEGQTQFWGHILSARSGLLTKQDVLDELASDAATYDNMAGRAWRTVADTTNDPIIAQRRPKPWPNWQRSEDYYVEGALTWLDANATIDELSGGKKSMNDFARAFFGMNDRDYGELAYGFDDVVTTLNGVQPYDWAGFLKARIYSLQPHAPLDWIAKGGYRLDYTPEPTKWLKSAEKARKAVDLAYSLGMQISSKDSSVTNVAWDSPAFAQGITIGTTIVAIDDHAYTDDGIREAVTAAAASKKPIRLLIKQGDLYRTIEIPYYGGLRYPHLVKVGSGEGSLDRLLAPLPGA
jgi:predicted metalloprotease with PDZ domain